MRMPAQADEFLKFACMVRLSLRPTYSGGVSWSLAFDEEIGESWIRMKASFGDLFILDGVAWSDPHTWKVYTNTAAQRSVDIMGAGNAGAQSEGQAVVPRSAGVP